MIAGTIVAVSGQAGLWSVMGLVETAPPHGRLSRCRRYGIPPTDRLVGDGNLVVLAEPVFEPGQAVKHWGHTATIVADGPSTVRVFQEGRKPSGESPFYPGGVFLHVAGERDVERGALVAENIEILLKDAENVE